MAAVIQIRPIWSLGMLRIHCAWGNCQVIRIAIFGFYRLEILLIKCVSFLAVMGNLKLKEVVKTS